MIRIIVEEKMRAKDIIIEKVSRNFYGYLKENNAIFLADKKVIKPYEILDIGQVLEIKYEELPQDGYKSFEKLDIRYEDENYLIIYKAAHLLSIPSTKNPYDSVYNRVLGIGYNAYIFNRLDKETQGLMLIAKNKLARIALKTFNKTYLAITKNKLSNDQGRIEYRIAKEEIGIKRYVSDIGEVAITNYQLIKEENNLYYYLINLETGRTHQIRLHFAYLNSPLINDELYGENPNNEELGLICNHIDFINPFTNQNINIWIK